MVLGNMGRILFVNLNTGKIKEEVPEEKVYRDFIGGYGIGARLIFSQQKAGVDPLGPDNTLGIIAGPLTGSPALSSSRFTVVGKSPLTGGWGDSNSGGDFGPYLKFAGYDGVFFTGKSARPVYLFIKNGKAELRDAFHLWGKDTYETEDLLKSELGKETRVACIGPSGENLSLISGIITNKGRAAGRSGLGAVMGSKKLKAVAVMGKMRVPLADEKRAKELRIKQLAELKGPYVDMYSKYGTPALNEPSGHDGDAPVKNWGGVGVIDFPNIAPIGIAKIMERQAKKYACYRCPIGCGGHMKAGTTEYKYKAGVHKPEYETSTVFGTMCLNNNIESIIKLNDICNRYGVDTISAGVTIAFAMECYENGLITNRDTGGIELTWGNHLAIVAMTEKMVKREGFGDILADGVKVAADKIGKGAEKYAIHIGGQEIPMHDPKYGYNLLTSYRFNPTPARQGSAGYYPQGLPLPSVDPKSFSGRAEEHKIISNFCHIVNCAGMCVITYICLPNASMFVEHFRAITGWDVTLDELLKTGERIVNLRQAFNIREGLNPLKFKVPDRVLGRPPQTDGPLAGITMDADAMAKEYLAVMDWDPKTAKPSKAKLLQLGLDDVAKVLWP